MLPELSRKYHKYMYQNFQQKIRKHCCNVSGKHCKRSWKVLQEVWKSAFRSVNSTSTNEISSDPCRTLGVGYLLRQYMIGWMILWTIPWNMYHSPIQSNNLIGLCLKAVAEPVNKPETNDRNLLLPILLSLVFICLVSRVCYIATNSVSLYTERSNR